MEKRKMFPRMSDLREVHIRDVIEVKRIVGEGINSDPARIIYEYYDMDGKLLARKDDFTTLVDLENGDETNI